MREAVDLYFHILALWTPPALMHLVRDAHQQARQSTGHPIRRPSATVIPFRPARR
jgi:hypothetical protein